MCQSTAVTSAQATAQDIAPKNSEVMSAQPLASASNTTIELEVVSAISGDACCKVLAEPTWTVSRIKGEIARLRGMPISDQILLFGCTKLDDSAMVGSLGLGEGKQPLMLLRNPARNAASRGNGLTVDSEGNYSRVSWTVDAKQLMRRDAPASSSPFELNLGEEQKSCTFKLFISAQDGGSFKRKAGKARVQLKCISDTAEDVTKVSCTFSVEAQEPEKSEASCNPVMHNFGKVALCSAPQEIDLCSLASSKSSRFVVSVEVARPGACAVGTSAAAAGA